MMSLRRLLAIVLVFGMIVPFIPMFPEVSANPAFGTPDPGLVFYPNTSGVPDGFKTADIAGESFNGEGVWITEIYNNDVNRSVEGDTRATDGYEPIHLYDINADLMEFIEVVSTHDEDIKLNDLYEFYCGTSKLNITTVSGSSDITVKRGQPVVIWNYRTDLGVTLPTEAEFREDMHIPDTAMVLKIVDAGDLVSNISYSIKNKQTGKTMCSFTTENNVNLKDGLGVELKLPMMGSDLEIYRSLTLPSAGYVYAPQVRYLYTAQPIEGFNSGKGVYITEIRANDTDRSGTYGSDADLMECVEIYNGTDAAIDLNKDYKLVYTVKEGYRRILPLYNYGTSSNGYVGSSTGCTVPAGGTAVIWCYRRALDTNWTSFPTLSQFRSAYGISSSTPVYIFTNQNSLTNANRSIELFKADGNGLGQLVSTFSWQGGVDLSDGKSAQLAINPEGPEMLLYEANGTTSMGTVPADQLKFVVDYGDAVTMHLADGYTVPEYVMQGDPLRVNFFYDFNGRTSRTATECYYRLDGTGSWTKVPDGGIRIPNLFEVIIPAYYLFDHDYVEFYAINSNKLRDTVLGIYKVPIRKLNEVDGIRTNISQGEEVRGTVSITANDGSSNSSTKIYIDGTQYSTTQMMEDGAYFSFKTDDIGGSCKSQITTTKNETIAHIGDFLFSVPDDQLVHIDNRYFSYNSSTKKYTVTLRFWAGTDGIASEDYLLPSGGRDDYSVTDLQLKLPNGNYYLPSSIGPSSYNGVDTSAKTNLSTALSAVHWIGDSSKMSPYMNVSFTIPASEANAVGLSLDTTKLSDGEHTLKVTNGTYTQTVTFIVDNTAPAVDLGIANGASLVGDISISPKITETYGMQSLHVLLDGEEIDTPYATTAYKLGQGSHTLQATVTDVAGNSTTKTITFNVEDVSMTLTDAGSRDVTGTSAKLYLSAQSGSATDVTFYKAEKIDAAQIQSETVSGLVPYLSYTINVGSPDADDEIVVSWNGDASGSDSTYACNMFVRNVTNGRWEPIGKADANGSITNASFVAENHVENGKAQVIVQCTSGSSLPDTDTVNDGIKGTNSGWDGNSRPEDYDFSFAWITDTQAYVQRTNYHKNHHLKMMQWIVDNREAWKISYVMHTGDLVDDPDAIYMWEHADEAAKIFDDADMPYGVLAGNHDIYAMLDIRDEYYNYFGEDRFKDKWYYGESFENNYGHYDLISQNGQDFIIVYMSYDLYEDEINWLNQVLAKYSNRKAILCFHAYTHVYESQEGNLSYYGVLIRDQVVAKNPNVFAVLSGHFSGASYQTARFDDNGDGKLDRTVYQICTDYQDLSAGGLQYIKFLYFDLDNDKVYVNSYSPYKNDFNYYDSDTAPDLYALAKAASNGKVNNGDVDIDSSILTVDFTPKQYSISGTLTDAAIYTDEVLGTAQLQSGTAEVRATGLSAGTNQAWYAVLENENSGYLRTGSYEFTTTHDYVAVVTPPTCLTPGYTTYTCSACGHSFVADEVPVSGHSYDDGVVTTEPGCTVTGVITYTCTLCGDSYQKSIYATGHSYQPTVTPPTCTESGYTIYTCSKCGDSYVADTTVPGGHNYDAGTRVEATCTNGGYTTYTCLDCGEQYVGDRVSAKGHSYTGKDVPPTCVDSGYTVYTCIVCGDSYEGNYVSANGHSYGSVVTPPTCTAHGYTVHTCIYCGENYTDSVVAATGHSFVDGFCTVCGAADPDYVGVVKPTLTLMNPTLAFEDEILYNVYFTADNVSSVVEMGLVTFPTRDTNGTVDNGLDVVPGYVKNSDGSYTVHTNGIPAKMLGDALYFRVYAKLTDGSYAYSGVVGYHAVAYANSVLKSTSASAEAKALVVAMLNYGAAAQVNFEYKTESLMNAKLTADQQALVDAYSDSMVAAVPTVSTTKAGSFMLNGGYTDVHPTVSFEGAFSINYYITPKYNPEYGTVTFYYWNLNDFNSAAVLTTGNATGSVKMQSTTGVYNAAIEGIAAKAIDEPVYIAAVYTNGGTSYYTPVIGYSLGAYCKNLAANGNAFGAATAVYGYYAKAYFA